MPQSSASKVSEAPTVTPSKAFEGPEMDVEPEGLLSRSSNEEDGTGSTDSSPTKATAA